jgi:hypothetical protein
MTAARASAPTLAWLLTALTGLLVGMAIVESRHQTVALPIWAPLGTVVTVEAAAAPTATPGSSRTPTPGTGEHLAPSLTLLSESAVAWPAAGTATLQLKRLILPSGTSLAPEVASGPTVLLVEFGALSIAVNDAALAGPGLDVAYPNSVLRSGERTVVASDTLYAFRNDGSMEAVALLVTILPG